MSELAAVALVGIVDGHHGHVWGHVAALGTVWLPGHGVIQCGRVGERVLLNRCSTSPIPGVAASWVVRGPLVCLCRHVLMICLRLSV